MKNPQFKEDWRKENPKLHLLYVKLGVKHLSIIDNCYKQLSSTCNVNMAGPLIALQKERNKLLKYNAAYADAQEILDLIADAQEIRDLIAEVQTYQK